MSTVVPDLDNLVLVLAECAPTTNRRATRSLSSTSIVKFLAPQSLKSLFFVYVLVMVMAMVKAVVMVMLSVGLCPITRHVPSCSVFMGDVEENSDGVGKCEGVGRCRPKPAPLARKW